jgi:hypothetical protein
MITILLASMAAHASAVSPVGLAPTNHAISLTWDGAIDTDVDFSEFWDKDFTIVTRFMEQFPYAYAGPILSVQGTGNFQVGQGDYFWKPGSGATTNGWPWKTKEGRANKIPNLAMWIGGTQVVAPAPSIQAGYWNQLAVVKSGGKIQMYLNGTAMGEAITAPPAPKGKLRIGRPGEGAKVEDGRAGQFYGLVDDVAVISKALSASELKTGVYATGTMLGGFEPDLFAGFTFEKLEPGGRPLPIKLGRKVTLTKMAKQVLATPDRMSGFDRLQMAVFTTPSRMILPIPANQEWYVIQGYADGTGSHNGYAAFCLDIDLAKGQPQTLGAPFTASAMGFLTTVREDLLTGNENNPNSIAIRQNPGFWAGYFHLQENSFSKEFQGGEWVKANKKNGKINYPMGTDFNKDAILVKAGDPLARVSSVGAGAAAFHLHFAISDLPDLSPFSLPQTTFATIPAAFRDFEVKQPNGSWKKVAAGYLEPGMVIRRTVD